MAVRNLIRLYLTIVPAENNVDTLVSWVRFTYSKRRGLVFGRNRLCLKEKIVRNWPRWASVLQTVYCLLDQ